MLPGRGWEEQEEEDEEAEEERVEQTEEMEKIEGGGGRIVRKRSI